MLALIDLPIVTYNPVIQRILKHVVVIRYGHDLFMPAPFQASGVYKAPHLFNGVFARGVEFEGFLDKRCLGAVYDNGVGIPVVYIAHRRPGRPDAIAQLLAYAALNVLGQVVHVILGLAESDREHEFALRCGVEPKGGELERKDLAGVHQIYQAATINGVTAKPVRVPGDYALGRALLDAGDHLVEYLAARFFGRFALNELADNGEAFLSGVVA
ncbi:MAG: hypothetical protein PHV36_14310 [Elusimicrobiales bacterium]|nr:hypothetical protein [Elusimicrobiales bacterium]